MYHSKLLNNNFDSIQALRKYETEELMRRSVPTAEEDAYSNLPAEQQRAVVERMVAGDQQKAAIVASNVDIATFLELHPEYADCQYNSDVMNLTLRGMKKAWPVPVSLEDLEEAYELVRGNLKMNEKVVKEQQRGGIEQRANTVRQQREFDANFDESECDN